MADELRAALSRIRELNIELGRDPATDPILQSYNEVPEVVVPEDEDAIRVSAAGLYADIQKRNHAIERLRAEADKSIDLHRRIIAANQDDDGYSKKHIEDKAHDIIRYNAHLDVLNRKMERLFSDPESMFLPLGTVVRFTGEGQYELSTSYTDNRKSYPVAGTIGVITGLKREGEFSLGVSVRDEFRDGWGNTMYPDYESIPTYRVDPDMLEVLSYGTFPDGSECHSYGWTPTHETDDRRDDERREMIIEANGYFWRLHHFEGRGVECLMAHEDMTEYSWITGTIGDFSASSPSP